MTGKGGTAIRGLEQSPRQGRAVGGSRQGRARITATPSEKRALTRLRLRLKDGARGPRAETKAKARPVGTWPGVHRGRPAPARCQTGCTGDRKALWLGPPSRTGVHAETACEGRADGAPLGLVAGGPGTRRAGEMWARLAGGLGHS